MDFSLETECMYVAAPIGVSTLYIIAILSTSLNFYTKGELGGLGSPIKGGVPLKYVAIFWKHAVPHHHHKLFKN